MAVDFRQAVIMARALLRQVATPSAPPAGMNAVYAKSDGQVYTQTPAGVEAMLNDTETFPFALGGTLVVGVGALQFPLGASYRIVEVRVRVGTAPTGSSVIVDVLKNGTSIYTGVPSNRPTVAVSTQTATGGAPATTTFAAGDYLGYERIQVGSTVAGSDLVVAIRLQRTA